MLCFLTKKHTGVRTIRLEMVLKVEQTNNNFIAILIFVFFISTVQKNELRKFKNKIIYQ